ncbi:aromatic acid exporter family protein [Finegoldia magna]|uniref:aromatic acid exporter family protein n=1 Tax=Finegoldia magna TaxID=1260 RepID=UPI00399A3487
MRKSIISRTIKTALASLLAIIVSQELSLEFAAAAGIIAILNVFDTRKATIEGGLKRTLSAIIALLIGGFLFEKIGYKTWVFGLYLLLFVPVSFLLKIELGLGPSSVIVTHLLAFGKIDVLIILNEMALVFIGTGFAMLTNFYAPTRQDKLNRLIESIYDDMKFILNLFGESLVQNLDVKLYEDKISELEADIDKAIDIAIIENDNLIENSRDLLFDLRLREREMDLLQEMYDDLRTIPPEYSDGKYISDILIQASQNLTKREDMIKLKERIDFLKNHYHMMELPDTHEEFAIRSAIFQVFRSLDQFIDISNQITKIPNNKIRIKTRG